MTSFYSSPITAENPLGSQPFTLFASLNTSFESKERRLITCKKKKLIFGDNGVTHHWGFDVNEIVTLSSNGNFYIFCYKIDNRYLDYLYSKLN